MAGPVKAADAIVTRGGTTTCAKALHFRCPIIFNAFGGIMPQEQLTWKFFRNAAACEKIESAADFTRLTALAATGLMRRLSYPHDYAELDRVRDAVLADVGVSGRS